MMAEKHYDFLKIFSRISYLNSSPAYADSISAQMHVGASLMSTYVGKSNHV